MKLDRSSGLVHPAHYVASPNCDPRPAGTDIDVLVVHCISLPPGQYGGSYIEQLFCNALDPTEHEYFEQICHLTVSAHFLIRRDGALIQFVPTYLRAWHAGESTYQDRANVNDFSLGVELEGTDDTAFTDAQYDVLGGLTSALIMAYPALSESRLVGHSDIAPDRKTDPGEYFDWERYRRLLR